MLFAVLFGSLAKFSAVFLYLSVFCLFLVVPSWIAAFHMSDGKRYIQSDYEKMLKANFMKKFVSIFFDNGCWKESFLTTDAGMTNYNFKESRELTKKLRETKIFNPFPYIRFDDMIKGEFKGININIYEANSNILNRITLFVIPFLIIFLFVIILSPGTDLASILDSIMGFIVLLTLITLGLFAILLLVIIILLIFVFFISLWKLPQYRAFRGVVVEMNMNKNFSGHTFFHDNSLGAKQIPFDKKKYQKVNLESVSFENKYNVYSDDQIEARYLFTTSFMDRIENLKFSFKAEYVRGAFIDNKLILAIHTNKDMLAMGSDFKDTDKKTFENLYDEMISILKIVDELKLDQHLGL